MRTVARKIADWINRLGTVWVEGQITQISLRPGAATAFLTLRDPSAEVSLTLTCSSGLLRKQDPPLTDGSRVVVHGKPTFFVGRGTLSLRVDEIRAVGIGELLARIERLVVVGAGWIGLEVTAAARERGLPALAVVGRADPACTGVEAVSLSDEFGPEESWTRTADCVREAVTAHLLREVIEA